MSAVLQPWRAVAPRALRASAPRTATATTHSLTLARRPARGLHQFSSPARPVLSQQQRLGNAAAGGASRRRQQAPPVRAQQDDAQQPSQQEPGGQQSEAAGGGGAALGSIGLWLLWGGLLTYAFFFSPNQTPIRDGYLLEYIVKEGAGLSLPDEPFKVNVVFKYLFYIMGVWPLVYTALLFPAGRSGNGAPAWPFVTLSYAFGAFGLLPYMALWTPPKDPPQLPPAKEELEGWGNVVVKGMESPITALVALGGGIFCLYQMATAGIPAWNDYLKLFDESRLVHVTSIDFLTLTALAPFWMWNDAALRKWEPRDKVLPLLSVLPVVGPALYLCLRPRAK